MRHAIFFYSGEEVASRNNELQQLTEERFVQHLFVFFKIINLDYRDLVKSGPSTNRCP